MPGEVHVLLSKLPKYAAVAFDIITFVNALHSSNALVLILVTEFGIVIDVNKLQYANADSPILVTEFGIVIDVNALQPKNA